MTDERLRAAYAAVLARRRPVDRTDCVSPEALLALAERRGPEDDRLATLDHAMACAACRQDLELLRATVAGWRRAARRPSPAVLALAASLVVLIGAGVVWRLGREQTGDVMRGGAVELELLAPQGAVPPGPVALTWRPVPGAARYDVEVFDAEGQPMFGATTTDTTLILPDSTAARLATGMEHGWWLRALLADGSERRAVPLMFRVTR